MGGRFKAGGKTYMATRFARQEMDKPDPGALTVSTRCSNKLCVRHLSTRTRAAMIASVSRRWASGEASHLARVSSKQVFRMRKLYADGNVARTALAERFGISTSNMKRILARALLETHLTRTQARLRILESTSPLFASPGIPTSTSWSPPWARVRPSCCAS
jgi:hypothetical protein